MLITLCITSIFFLLYFSVSFISYIFAWKGIRNESIIFLKCSIISLFVLSGANAGELTILHINDHHSHLRADSRMSLKIGGEKTR